MAAALFEDWRQTAFMNNHENPVLIGVRAEVPNPVCFCLSFLGPAKNILHSPYIISGRQSRLQQGWAIASAQHLEDSGIYSVSQKNGT